MDEEEEKERTVPTEWEMAAICVDNVRSAFVA